MFLIPVGIDAIMPKVASYIWASYCRHCDAIMPKVSSYIWASNCRHCDPIMPKVASYIWASNCRHCDIVCCKSLYSSISRCNNLTSIRDTDGQIRRLWIPVITWHMIGFLADSPHRDQLAKTPNITISMLTIFIFAFSLLKQTMCHQSLFTLILLYKIVELFIIHYWSSKLCELNPPGLLI